MRSLIALTVLTFAAPALAASLDPQLVVRLGQSAEKAELQKVTSVQAVTADELDSSGKVAHTQRTVTRVTYPDGKRKVELLLALEDGKPGKHIREKFEEEQKKAAEQGDAPKNAGGPLQSPFAPSVRDGYVFDVVGTEGGLLHVRVQPKERDEKSLAGDVWIDEAAGAIVRSKVHPAKYPRFVDQADFELKYDVLPDGPRLSRMDGQFVGGVFFLRKRGRTAATFHYGADADAAAAQALAEEKAAAAK